MGTYFVIDAVVLLFVMILIAVIRIRNRFVMLCNRVKNQMAQIEVQLKRRYDLIPNLLETAKDYANFERDTLEVVVKARQSTMEAADFNQAAAVNGRLQAAFGRLLVVSESYLELKVDGNFLQPQRELANMGNKISVAWQLYNDIVLKHNNAIELSPVGLVTGLCGSSPTFFWETQEAERENISIKAGDIKSQSGDRRNQFSFFFRIIFQIDSVRQGDTRLPA